MTHKNKRVGGREEIYIYILTPEASDKAGSGETAG